MSLLTRTRLNTLQNWPHLSTNWHFLAATALSVSNRSQEIGHVYLHALNATAPNHQLELTSKFRESILKSGALIGIPRTINGLTALSKVTPNHLKAHTVLRKPDVDLNLVGTNLFSAVYGKITDRVRSNMFNAYPDLDYYVQNFVYGALLSNDVVLTKKETSLAVVASLVPQNADPQLRGHLKGALNNGATIDEVNSVRDMVIELISYYGETVGGSRLGVDGRLLSE